MTASARLGGKMDGSKPATTNANATVRSRCIDVADTKESGKWCQDTARAKVRACRTNPSGGADGLIADLDSGFQDVLGFTNRNPHRPSSRMRVG